MLLSQARLSRLLVALLVALCAVSLAAAQVNFSPSWGKRGTPQDACKPSVDSLMYLYKLIQDEAQKMTDCEKFGN